MTGYLCFFPPLAIFLYRGYLGTALRMDDTNMITEKGYGFLDGSTIVFLCQFRTTNSKACASQWLSIISQISHHIHPLTYFFDLQGQRHASTNPGILLTFKISSMSMPFQTSHHMCIPSSIVSVRQPWHTAAPFWLMTQYPGPFKRAVAFLPTFHNPNGRLKRAGRRRSLRPVAPKPSVW
jgi:hypothetical protein